MTGLILGAVDALRDKTHKKKRMSIVTARCAPLAAAIALSACFGGKPAGRFASDEAGAIDGIHGSNAVHGKTGMTMLLTSDPDTDFLQDMIPHHGGAVEMARAEIAKGTDTKVRAMAKEVIRTRQGKIVKVQTCCAERQAAKKETR